VAPPVKLIVIPPKRPAMKNSFAITLVIAGVFVLAIPAVWHAWDSFMVAVTMSHMTRPDASVSFADVPQLYQFVCWAVGAGMIAISVASSFIPKSSDSSSRLAVSAG
jgi:hypothetical protein